MGAGPRRLWRSAPTACGSGHGWWRHENRAVHPEHKRRIVAATGEQTVLSSIFGPEWPQFNPMRVIRNRVVEEWNERLGEVPTQRDNLPEIGRTRFLGREHGDAQIQRNSGDRGHRGGLGRDALVGWDRVSASSTTFPRPRPPSSR